MSRVNELREALRAAGCRVHSITIIGDKAMAEITLPPAAGCPYHGKFPVQGCRRCYAAASTERPALPAPMEDWGAERPPLNVRPNNPMVSAGSTPGVALPDGVKQS